jgi:hypothetical protein
MRSFWIIALLVALTGFVAKPQAAVGRHFWQTYGATVASPDGGCAWNLNSDYFVPRHCGSGTYDLFSPCKQHYYRSPACRNLHPVYCGYCTPYGECHYKWRDHVYKKHCGCTPLACHYGPWDLEKCRKHGGCAAAGGCAGAVECAGDCWQGAYAPRSPEDRYSVAPYEGDYLPNVEPMELETLGTIAATSLRMQMGGGAMTSGGVMNGAMGMPQGQTLPPPMGLLPGTTGGSTGLGSTFGSGM